MTSTLRSRISSHLPMIAAVALAALSLALHVLEASRAVIPVYWEDEAGYLGNAQVMAGAAEGFDLRGNPYYIGWSAVLVPLWWIFGALEPVYRAAVVVAALCGVATMLPLWGIGRLLGLRRWMALASAAVVSFVPAQTAMSSFALSENFLTLLVAAAAYAAARFFRDGSVRWAVLLAVFSSLAFLTHGRVVAVLGATIVGFAFAYARARRASLIGAAVAVVLSAGGFLLYRSVSELVFGAGSGREDKGLGRLFAPEVWSSLLSALGQGWYHIATTALLAVLGAAWLTRRTRNELRARRVGVGVWASVGILGSIVVAVTFIAPVIAKGTPRFDVYSYGRYLEPVVLPVAMIGIAVLVLGISRRFALTAAGVAVAVSGLFLLVVLPIIPRSEASWFAPINVGGMLWAPWPVVSRWAGSPWVPVAAFAVACAIAIIVLRRRPRFVVGLLAAAFACMSVAGLWNTIIPFTAPFTASFTLREALRDPLFEGEPVQFDVAVADPKDQVDSASQNAYQLFLEDQPLTLFDSRETTPTAELVIARTDWPDAAELGAIRLADDTGIFDNALWVLPGGLADRLVTVGRITR